MILRIVVMGAMAFMSFGALGEGIVGNGGDVIYCANGAPQAELLEVYEARRWHGISIKAWPGNTYQEKLRSIATSLATRMPRTAERLLTEALQFEAEAHMVMGTVLDDIPDSDHIAIPVDCEIKQIVIQRTPSQFVKRYLVSQELWSMLDENNKAALVMHEVLYKEALKWSARNSLGIRDFNIRILSETLNALSDKDLFDYLYNVAYQRTAYETSFHSGWVQFPYETEYRSNKLKVPDFDSAGKLTSTYITRPLFVRTKSGDIEFQGQFSPRKTGFQIEYAHVLNHSLVGVGATLLKAAGKAFYYDNSLCGQMKAYHADPDCAIEPGALEIFHGKVAFSTEFGQHMLDSTYGRIVIDAEEIGWNYAAGVYQTQAPTLNGSVTIESDRKIPIVFSKDGKVVYVKAPRLQVSLKNGNLTGQLKAYANFIDPEIDLRPGVEVDLTFASGNLSLQGNSIPIAGENFIFSSDGTWTFTTHQSFYLYDTKGIRHFVPGAESQWGAKLIMSADDKLIRMDI